MLVSDTFRPAARAAAAAPFRAPAAERYARAALDRECAEVARTTGGRNDRLNRAAHALGQFVGANALDEGEVIAGLMDAATACGHVHKRGAPATLATIRSGLRAGIASPRDIPLPTTRDGGSAEVRREDPVKAARRAHDREVARLAQAAEGRITAERVRRLWDQAACPIGTLVERYLNNHRGLDLPDDACGHAIRFLAAGPFGRDRAPLMIAAFRDLTTDEITGLHRTRLDPVTAAKVGRMMLGQAKGSAIKLSADDTVSHGLHVCEGVETGLAGLALGLRPMWAMGSTSGIASLPALAGIETLTVCAEAGDASADAVQQVGQRWAAAGREVLVSHPRRGSDLNDAIRQAA